MADSVSDSQTLPSTPPSSIGSGVPSDTIQPVSGNPIPSDVLDPAVVKRLLSTKGGQPRKSDLSAVRLAQMEENLEEIPDGELDNPRHAKIDLTDGRAALETQMKKELGRKVKVKGSARKTSPGKTETKFARLVRKVVNLGMSGDKDMIKLVFLYLGGRPALASKEDKPSSVVMHNSIPTPVETPDGK